MPSVRRSPVRLSLRAFPFPIAAQRPLAAALVVAVALSSVTAGLAQRPFREYPALEGEATEVALPPDYQNPAELILGRLMFPGSRGRGGFGGFGGGDWTQGRSVWTVDYPKGDRFFAAVIRRLTRIDVRSVEQPVNPIDGDDIYYWPYMHVGLPGSWQLTDEMAGKIRDYLLRGGFLFCDSFFGTAEWEGFVEGMRKIFPDREIEDLPITDPIFHTLYDIENLHQVGNFRSLMRAGVPYRADGVDPHWRGIRDDRGRVVVAIAFNNDLGDSWHLADEPRYPEKYSALGIRVGVNNVVYAMTH